MEAEKKIYRRYLVSEIKLKEMPIEDKPLPYVEVFKSDGGTVWEVTDRRDSSFLMNAVERADVDVEFCEYMPFHKIHQDNNGRTLIKTEIAMTKEAAKVLGDPLANIKRLTHDIGKLNELYEARIEYGQWLRSLSWWYRIRLVFTGIPAFNSLFYGKNNVFKSPI